VAHHHRHPDLLLLRRQLLRPRQLLRLWVRLRLLQQRLWVRLQRQLQQLLLIAGAKWGATRPIFAAEIADGLRGIS